MIEILDSKLRKIKILKQYDYAQSEEKFRGIGTFEIHAKRVKENLFLLSKEKYYVLFDNERLGEIENSKKDSDGSIKNNIVLKGRLIKNILNCFVNNGTINFKGKTYELPVALIQENILKDPKSNRYIDLDLKVVNEPYLQTVCKDINMEITGGYLWEKMLPVLEQDNLGLLFYPVLNTTDQTQSTEPNIKKFEVIITAGADRRKGNKEGNREVIFSQSLSNINRTSYERKTDKYRGTAYIAGEGEGKDRKWFVINREGEQKGINRKELFIDARDIQTEQGENKLTPEEYEYLINKRTQEKFKENDVLEVYQATVDQQDTRYKYGTDYFIGDWVTVIDQELDLEISVQIVSVTRTELNSSKIIDVSFQYGLNKKSEIKESVEENKLVIEKIENNITFINGAIEKLKQKQYSYILCSANPNNTQKDGIIDLKNVLNKTGNDFELMQDGSIKIVGNIEHILVHTSIGTKSGVNGRSWLQLIKVSNGAEIIIDKDLKYGVYTILKINRIVKVKKGDLIKLKVFEIDGLSVAGLASQIEIKKED